MSDILTTKATLQDEFQRRMAKGEVGISDPVGMTPTILGGRIEKANDDDMYKAVIAASGSARPMGSRLASHVSKYGSAYDIPMGWSDGTTASVRSRIASGKLKLPADPQASTNTLTPDWENLWEAVRLDLTIRKMGEPTIRQYMYAERALPNASRSVNLSEILPFGVVFDENNGEGQAITQGESRGGKYDAVTMNLFAAGFTWTLLAELFDNSMDMGRLADAVAVGYGAKRDDNAIDPILNYSFGGAGSADHTAAATLSGANRQELLYLTMQDAIDDISERKDPVTGREIDATGLVCLASEYDARHISKVVQGLPSTNERTYGGLSEVTRVLGYNGETINLRDRDVTYTGVTKGTAYLVKPNRYMVIPIKRGLQVEVDMTPDVKTLARQERAYWFAEGVYTEGIQYFVQKITLPAW